MEEGRRRKQRDGGRNEASGRDKCMMAGEELDSGERKEWKTKEERERRKAGGRDVRKSGGAREARGGMGPSLGSLFGMKDNRRGRDEKTCTTEHANTGRSGVSEKCKSQRL